jgi:signal transduction histidine kinase/DNA-binding response OmpR family regulator
MRETGQRILYMEDHLYSARLVQNRLQQHGYVVDLARDGAEGLAMLEKQQYSLILLDPHIPMQGGLNILQTLTARDLAPPVIMIVEQHDVQTAALAVRLGANDYLFQGSLDEHLQLLPMVVERTLQKHRQQTDKDHMLEELRQNNRSLLLLTRTAQLLTSTLDMQVVISQLVQTITEIVITEGSSVWLWDREKAGYLTCTAMYLDGQDITAHKVQLPVEQGVVGWVARHGETVNITDASQDPRFAAAVDSKTGYRTKSILAVPLITQNQVIGVLELVNKLEGHFDTHDVELAETIAAYAANAIQNAQLMASVSRHRDALETQNEALDAFAHSVAHDLKNPLTLIVGFADMLRDSIATFPEESIKESLNTIVEYGIKMSSIVDALLMLASVGTDDEVETEAVDMSHIIREVLKRMEHMFKEYQAEVTVPEGWPAALGYGPWLEEVWYNYLSNAVKYGGRPPRLELGFFPPEGGMICFWVKDNGAGIALENPMMLFTPQGRRNRNRSQTGHGLGLSIVHRIVDRLGGKVGVESVAGGSRFSFTLPVSVAKASTE